MTRNPASAPGPGDDGLAPHPHLQPIAHHLVGELGGDQAIADAGGDGDLGDVAADDLDVAGVAPDVEHPHGGVGDGDLLGAFLVGDEPDGLEGAEQQAEHGREAADGQPRHR